MTGEEGSGPGALPGVVETHRLAKIDGLRVDAHTEVERQRRSAGASLRALRGRPGGAAARGGSDPATAATPTARRATRRATSAQDRASRSGRSAGRLPTVMPGGRDGCRTVRRPAYAGSAILLKVMATYRELLAQVKEEIDEVSSVRRARAPRRRRSAAACSTSASRTSGRRAICPARCTSLAATSSRGSRRSSPTARARSSSTAPSAPGRRSPPSRSPSSATRTSSSLVGGFTDWKRNGYAVRDAARRSRPEQRARYSRHILIPEVGEEGQQKLLDARVLLIGAGGLGSPVVALPRRGGRRHARHRRRRRRRRLEPAAPDRALHGHARRAEGAVGQARARGAQPRRQRADLRGAADLRERRADPRRRLGRDRRRRRQLPHALPRQRRLRLARHPGRPRLDLPLRGPGDGLPSPRRPVLPLPLPRPAAAGARSELLPRAACSASCRASSARSRRARRSS